MATMVRQRPSMSALATTRRTPTVFMSKKLRAFTCTWMIALVSLIASSGRSSLMFVPTFAGIRSSNSAHHPQQPSEHRQQYNQQQHQDLQRRSSSSSSFFAHAFTNQLPVRPTAPCTPASPISSGAAGSGISVTGRHGHHRPSTLRLRAETIRATLSQLFLSVPQLDRWRLLPNGSVVGTVANHPQISDGDIITTSPLVAPETARSQVVVETASGSKYRLLTPMTVSQQEEPGQRNGYSLPFNAQLPFQAQPKERDNDPWKQAIDQYQLTTETIGLDDEYLLAGSPVRSTSGKSKIWEAFRSDPNNGGLPAPEPAVCIKTSSNLEAVTREFENYKRIGFLGFATGRFVQCYDFFPVAGYGNRFRNQCALVLEMGARDLKSYLDQKGGRVYGEELRGATLAAAQCVQALHSAGLVWTDLKTENFVVMSNGEVKGIDLESAMPAGDSPVDYSPEACPPEFATAFLAGDGPYFKLDYSYDVWSLGMFFWEIAAGRGYFDGQNPAQITKYLRDSNVGVPVDELDCDAKLKDLISKCLDRNPQRRPRMAQVLLHPYFFESPLKMIGL